MKQRDMERQVLHVLHRARQPKVLVELPLVQSICRQTGESNPVTALERVVHAALPGTDRKTAKLKSVILEVDFERNGTNRQAARQRGVSRRHFQRLRAQAVSAIARYACDALDEREPESAVAPAAHRESLWRFDREREAYVAARERANAPQMRAIAANMLRIAQNEEARLSALARLADANLRLGRFDEALEQRLELRPGARLFVDARHALLHGRLAEAQADAQAAIRALPPHSDDRFAARLLSLEVTFARGGAWPAQPGMEIHPPASWERAALEAEYVRHLVTLSPLEATSLAAMTWRRAAAFEYHGVAARCAAALSELGRLRHDAESERRWRARAIECLLRTSDLTIASALFPSRVYRDGNSMDDALCATLYERLCLVVPQMQGENGRQRAAVRSLLEATIDATLAIDTTGERLEAAVRSVARSDSAFAHYVQPLARPVSEMFALTLAALSGRSWDDVLVPASGLVTAIGARLRPARPRAFPIVLPHWAKSQSSVADHLRIDELARLRVRFVPVRSGSRGTLAWKLGGAAPRATRKAIAAVDSR